MSFNVLIAFCLAVGLALLLPGNCQSTEQRNWARQQVKENRISANNSVLLLLDHQVDCYCLLSLVTLLLAVVHHLSAVAC
jgi:hypothetical protein